MAKLLYYSAVVIAFGSIQEGFTKLESQKTTNVSHNSQSEIAILKQQIAALSNKVNALEKKEAEVHYKEKVTHTEQAPIQMVQSGNTQAKLKISGMINRGVAYYDNGRNKNITHVDIDAAPSRINISSEANYNKDLKVGAVLEMAVKSNSSEAFDIGQDDNSASSVYFRKRKIEVYFDHQRYGMLSLGQGEAATHYVSGVDLTGTDMFTQGADLAGFAGGVRFINGTIAQQALLPVPGVDQSDSNSPDRDRQVGDVWIDVLGSRRVDRIRYDTPNFYGFVLSASHSPRDLTDYALRYAGEWSKTKVAVALGYANVPFSNYLSNAGTRTVRKGRREYGGSTSVLFPIGISVGGSLATKIYRDPGRRNGTVWTTKLGYQHAFMPTLGNTCFAVTYGRGRALFDDTVTPLPSDYTDTTFSEDNSEKVRIYGAYLVQNLDRVATEVFIGVQYHHLSRTPFGQSAMIQEQGYNFKRILASIAGARIKF
ncbi:MAG: porin [Janthinobacterium lividum]